METWMIALIVAVVLLALGATAWTVVRTRRSANLRRRFGLEYERAVQSLGSRKRGEAELESRAKRLERVQVRPLSPEDYERFAERWRVTQALFVDSPGAAVADAERLVQEVMRARGYPVGDFDQRSADLSVDHASVVENYRAARNIAINSRLGSASTEDLRKAVVHYRILFEDLLETEGRKGLAMAN